MSRTIMVFCGRPRKDGITNTLVDWVTQGALEAGAAIINDQWGLKREPRLAELAAETGAALILMSNQRDKGGYDALHG